jgi:RNAse (barnase) inhibitor barstar
MNSFCFGIRNVARNSRPGFLIRNLTRGLLVAVLLIPCLNGFADDTLAPAPPAEAVAASQQSPVTDILVVLDATSSMAYRTASENGASRIDLARLVTSSVLDVAPDGIRLGVLTLRDDVSELRPLQPMSPADRTVIRRGVGKLFPFGDGDLVECFQRIIDKLDTKSTPLVILVTDGSDYRAESANLAAKQLKDRFDGRMKFVLVGICKAGEVADRLQTLGTFAGGDSLSLTSENDIPAGLASVREACDEVRRHRRLLQKKLEQQRDDLLSGQIRLNEELAQSQAAAEVLFRDVRVLQKKNLDVTTTLDAKNDEVRHQAGQLHEKSHQLRTAQNRLEVVTEESGALTMKHKLISAEVKQKTARVAELEKEAENRKAEIISLSQKSETDADVIQKLEKKISEFNASWAAAFVNHESLALGLLAFLVCSIPGGSALALKFGGLTGGLAGLSSASNEQQKVNDEQRKANEDQKKYLEEAARKIETMHQSAQQQLEKLREETSHQFAGISEGTTRQIDSVTQQISTTLAVVKEHATASHAVVVERLAGAQTESKNQSLELKASIERNVDQLRDAVTEKVDAPVRLMVDSLKDLESRLSACVTQATDGLDKHLAGTRTDGEKQAQELKASLERNVDQLRSAVVEKVDTPVRLMVDSLKELEHRLATCVNQATSRLDERLPATIAAPLQSSLADVRTQIEVLASRAGQFEESLPDRIRSTMQTELAELRSTIESGREGVDEMKDALRQDVERTAGETIRQVTEASTNLLAPASEEIRGIRAELVRQAQQAETSAQRTRETVTRVSRDVEQIPERMKATGKKISNVQVDVQSVRDQIDQLRREFESGMNQSERRQLKRDSREESRNSDLLRVATKRDEMMLNLRSEFAKLCDELKGLSPSLTVPLSRMEDKLLSILRELDRDPPTESKYSNRMDEVKTQLQELSELVESQQSPTTMAIVDPHQPEPVFTDTVNATNDSEEQAEAPNPVEAAGVPADSESAPAKVEQQAAPQPASEPVEETRRSSDAKRQNQWIRELRMLPGLGRKSAETLVDSGVNSIRELSDLGAGQKAVLREHGGRLRDIDDWVKAARKVRLLHDSLNLGLKDAVEFVISNSWPERFLQMPDSELAELSTEFPEILDWVRESRSDGE